MSLESDSFFSRFKKHYGHYLLGIVVPALVNGLSIPVFKYLLGAPAYGKYALYLNALLITNLLVSGWLSQGILRFYAKAADKKNFTRQVFVLSLLVGAVAFFPVVVVAWWQSQHMLTAVLFGVALFLAVVQLPLQAVTQSGFLSVAAISAEAIRTISWFAISLFLLQAGCSFLPSLLAALAASYLLSILFLYKKNTLTAGQSFVLDKAPKHLYTTLARYGWPFSVWFILYYLTAYIDKVLMLNHHGSVVQGHYSALSDFLSKSLGLVLAPVTIAAVPLLTEAYETSRHQAVRLLLKKLVLWEVAALLLLMVLYQFFGYKILFQLLHIPYSTLYQQAGLLILTGTMIWQIALLVHKPVELNLRSVQLLLTMASAFAIQFLFYQLPFFSGNALKYPAGYCLAACTYLLLIEFLGF